MKFQLFESLLEFSVPGELSAHLSTSVKSQKFLGDPKISVQLQCNPKLSALLMVLHLRNRCLNMAYNETMHIMVRISSKEPKNIRLTLSDDKEYHEHNFKFIWTQSCHFRQ